MGAGAAGISTIGVSSAAEGNLVDEESPLNQEYVDDLESEVGQFSVDDSELEIDSYATDQMTGAMVTAPVNMGSVRRAAELSYAVIEFDDGDQLEEMTFEFNDTLLCGILLMAYCLAIPVCLR